jgi:hypothetical protein
MENEINLSKYYNKLNEKFTQFRSAIINSIKYFFKLWWLTLPLLIGSVLLGYYMDSLRTPEKETTLIVNQNFDSVNYLYESINKLNSVIISGDTLFMEKIGLKGLKKIQIEPIINLEAILNGTDLNTRNLEAVLNEVPVDKENKNGTSLSSEAFLTNYNTHKIYLRSSSDPPELITSKLMSYLNSNIYFIDVKNQSILGLESDLVYNQQMIKQIDSILKRVQKYDKNSLFLAPQSDSDLNNLIVTKRSLVRANKSIKLKKIQLRDIIYCTNKPSFSKVPTKLSSKKIILIPFLFLLMFFILYLFKTSSK